MRTKTNKNEHIAEKLVSGEYNVCVQKHIAFGLRVRLPMCVSICGMHV